MLSQCSLLYVLLVTINQVVSSKSAVVDASKSTDSQCFKCVFFLSYVAAYNQSENQTLTLNVPIWQAVSDGTLSAGSLAGYPSVHFTEPAM